MNKNASREKTCRAASVSQYVTQHFLHYQAHNSHISIFTVQQMHWPLGAATLKLILLFVTVTYTAECKMHNALYSTYLLVLFVVHWV